MSDVRHSPYDGHRPEARVIEVVAVDFMRGLGQDKHNILRRVIAYFDKNGNFLAEHDPYAHLLPPKEEGS